MSRSFAKTWARLPPRIRSSELQTLWDSRSLALARVLLQAIARERGAVTSPRASGPSLASTRRCFLEVSVPFLAGTYDERMFEELRLAGLPARRVEELRVWLHAWEDTLRAPAGAAPIETG
ncbi:MAG: hypothetical protein ACXU86_19875 [Archangium sp.]